MGTNAQIGSSTLVEIDNPVGTDRRMCSPTGRERYDREDGAGVINAPAIHGIGSSALQSAE